MTVRRAPERLDGRPTAAERVLGFVGEVAAAPTVRRPSGTGVDVRLQCHGVPGSGPEHDGEVIQLPAFSVDGDASRTDSVAFPSLHRP